MLPVFLGYAISRKTRPPRPPILEIIWNSPSAIHNYFVLLEEKGRRNTFSISKIAADCRIMAINVAVLLINGLVLTINAIDLTTIVDD